MGGATGRDHDIDQLTKEVNWEKIMAIHIGCKIQ